MLKASKAAVWLLILPKEIASILNFRKWNLLLILAPFVPLLSYHMKDAQLWSAKFGCDGDKIFICWIEEQNSRIKICGVTNIRIYY